MWLDPVMCIEHHHHLVFMKNMLHLKSSSQLERVDKLRKSSFIYFLALGLPFTER